MVNILGTELLQVADSAAREKGIDRDEVIVAVEMAIQRAGRAKYGSEHDIRAHIDRKTGDIRLARYREVVGDDAEIENEFAQLPLSYALRENGSAKVGDTLVEDLPPIDFGRVAAQSAKQVIVQRVREAERARQYDEFIGRVGEIVNGLVRRHEYGHVVVDLGRAEAVLRREELIPREHPRRNDRVRALIHDVRQETRGPQIFLSRTRNDFLVRLFTQEVPEIYDGIIEIRAVARDPGSRAKIAVISHDPGIDPVGACVGMRGSRVQAVVSELQGERIDIIPWSEDPTTFIVNALAPAEVSRVLTDPETGHIEVVVPDDQLSQAIGRRGQNVRLAAKLTGWSIDILTEAEQSERRQAEMRQRSALFIDALNVDEMIAHLLVAEGFVALEEIAYVPLDELMSIEGFDEEIADELQRRAQDFLEQEAERLERERRELGVGDDLAGIESLTGAVLVALGHAGVRTLDDLADLASDELRYLASPRNDNLDLDAVAELDEETLAAGIAASPIDAETADSMIMAARAHWFEDGPAGGMPADARP